MNKILFLDIDGVLVNENHILEMYEIEKKEGTNISLDKYGHIFDPICVEFLKRIVKETEAKIVISSTWRLNGIISLKRMFKYRNIDLHILDITPCLESRIRGDEISEWLDNKKNIDSYVILDDEDDMGEKHKNNIVVTDPYNGITEIEMNKCIKILNKNNDIH